MFRTANTRPNVLYGFLAIAFAFIATGSVGFAQPNKQRIQWFEDLNSAVHYANTNNLPLLLHFYGDNCPPCRLLEKKTYQNGELIGKINSSVVAVRINGEKDKELRERYEVTRWPTDVYLLPNGSEIYRTVSPQDPAVYGKMIDRIALRHRDWHVEQVAAQKAAERHIANQTSSERAMSQPPQLSTISSSGSAPVVSHTRANAPANPQMIAVSSTTETLHPNVQPVSTGQDHLPTIVSQSNHQGMTQVVSNPHLHQEPAQAMNLSTDLQSQLPTISYAGNAPQVAKTHPKSQPPQTISVDSEFREQVVGVSQGIPVMAVSHPHVASSADSRDGAAGIASMKQSATKEATVGLDGFCPVSLLLGVKRETDPATCWTEGSPKFAVKHRGRIYLCASEDYRQRFLQAPDLYSPCLSGFDLIHYIQTQEFVDGKCEFGCFQGDTGRVFLFSNRENYDEFVQKEAYYSQLVNGSGQPERVASQPDAVPFR